MSENLEKKANFTTWPQGHGTDIICNLATSIKDFQHLLLDNCLLNRMKPSGSHSSAFSWLRLLPQNRDKLLSMGSI